MIIKIKYSYDGLWGYHPEATEGINTEVSRQVFEAMLDVEIKERWPQAEVEYVFGIADSYSVDGDTASDSVIYLGEIVRSVFEGEKWVVRE